MMDTLLRQIYGQLRLLEAGRLVRLSLIGLQA